MNGVARSRRTHARGFNERYPRLRGGGCPADGRTDAAENGRAPPSGLKSASTPRGVSAPMGSAAADRATRRGSGGGQGEGNGRVGWRGTSGRRGTEGEGEERGEGFTQPSPERKIHVENHAARRCSDKPRSTLGPRSPSLSSLRVAGKEGRRERERTSSFYVAVSLRGKETTSKLTSSVLPRRFAAVNPSDAAT